MLKKKDGRAGAKPTAAKKHTVNLDSIGKFLGRAMYLIGQIIVEVVSAFMLAYSFAIWTVPMLIIMVAETAGVTYESNGVDFVILVGAPGLMIILLCTILVCIAIQAEHRLLSKLRHAAIARQSEEP